MCVRVCFVCVHHLCGRNMIHVFNPTPTPTHRLTACLLCGSPLFGSDNTVADTLGDIQPAAKEQNKTGAGKLPSKNDLLGEDVSVIGQPNLHCSQTQTAVKLTVQ